MTATLDQLAPRIDLALAGDRDRLRVLLRKVEDAARRGQPHDRNLVRLEAELEASVALRTKRLGTLPKPTYPPELPVSQRRDEILRTIRDHQVAVIAGETGSGKSTQLPKMCLELGRGVDGLIGHTQPRRIAARTLAARVADELGVPLGREVGFKIRFTDTTKPETHVKLMTDGVLLAEATGDRELRAYDTILIDEAHERSLNIDFLLGYLKQLLPKRPDLKLIITSATINPQQFAEHFASADGKPAPIIEVSGRTYPVEVRYRPIGEAAAVAEDDGEAVRREPSERDVRSAIVDAVSELEHEGGGDVLVFLPTERDIRETHKALRSAEQRGTQVLPLYSRLSTSEQDRVFRPSGGGSGRRVVLATNVAETSLTVPGIRYVVDTGTARISRYSARSGVQRLPIEPISRASADQRKGRCGRVAEGVCVRLFSEDDFLQREPFTPPEILRTNLASVILQMKAMNLGEIEDFPFVEPPKAASIRDGYRTLYELGAIDDRDELTDIGRKLAKLPTDPRIARMLLEAHRENCLADVLVIAAALEVQDARLRPIDAQQAADEAHAKFKDERSDFLSLLRVWDFYHRLKESASRAGLEKSCRQNFLSPTRLREWADVHRQLREMLESLGVRIGKRVIVPVVGEEGAASTANRGFDAVHRSLLAGLLSRVALKTGDVDYTGAGGKKLYLWPGSSLFAGKPKWIVAAEHVETTRPFARTVARINPDWIEPLAKHLISLYHSEPHWVRELGSVAAYEKVSLFGLTVVPKRRVHYGPINPAEAREIFIQHALVLGEYDGQLPPFLKQNADLMERIEKVEAKARRRDLVADEVARFAFYDKRVPATIYDRAGFERWRKDAERGNAKLLHMTEVDLLAGEAGHVTQQAFPDHLQVGTMRLPLQYHLEPGAAEDGVTVLCPLPALNQLDRHRLEWLVPGLLVEKVTELIRAMPKQVRKAFVPAPDFAAKAVARVEFAKGPLHAALAGALRELTGVEVSADAFTDAALPPHLRMNVRVVDERGKPLAAGRDLGKVREELGAEAAETFTDLGDARFQRDGIRKWDFGTLPPQVDVKRAGVAMHGFPAIVDQGDSVSLRLLDTKDRAEQATRRGLRRLASIELGKEIRWQVERMPELPGAMVKLAPVIPAAEVKRQVGELIAERACVAGEIVLDAAAWEVRLNSGWNRISGAATEVAKLLGVVAEAYQRAALALADAASAPAFATVVRDAQLHLRELMKPNFLSDTPWLALVQYPRYLGGVQLRLQKLRGGGVPRDARAAAELAPHVQRYLARREQHRKQGVADPELETYRWMLEEFRVQLFAQELGTSMPVSVKRLDKQWERVRA